MGVCKAFPESILLLIYETVVVPTDDDVEFDDPHVVPYVDEGGFDEPAQPTVPAILDPLVPLQLPHDEPHPV